VAPEAGARQGAPQKRPQQPVLRQPATCRAACRPSVRCVSHIAGLASLCKDVYSPRPGIAPLLRSLHRRAVKTSGERRPGRPGAQPVKGPVAPQAAPEHADRRASGNCKEACSQAHARPGQPRPKPLFGQAATCWVSKSSSSVQPGALLDHPQHRASLAAARTGRCGRQEPVAVQRRAADRGMSRLLCMSYVLLLTTCLAHRSATSALNTTRSMHSRHMHTLLTNIGCRPAYVQETWTACCAPCARVGLPPPHHNPHSPNLAHARPRPTPDHGSPRCSAGTPNPPGRHESCGCCAAPRLSRRCAAAQAHLGVPAAKGPSQSPGLL